MNKDRRTRKHNSHWKNSSESNGFKDEKRVEQVQNIVPKVFRPPKAVTNEQVRTEEEAIKAFKASKKVLCKHCGQPIVDMTQAMADKKTGEPVHFDCVLEMISTEEHISSNDTLAYIGQGRFGIINFPNTRDMKHFTIKKIIEWEDKDNKSSWREKMADLYSQVK